MAFFPGMHRFIWRSVIVVQDLLYLAQSMWAVRVTKVLILVYGDVRFATGRGFNVLKGF